MNGIFLAVVLFLNIVANVYYSEASCLGYSTKVSHTVSGNMTVTSSSSLSSSKLSSSYSWWNVTTMQSVQSGPSKYYTANLAYQPMPTISGLVATVVPRPQVCQQSMFTPIAVNISGYQYYYGGYYKARLTAEKIKNGPEVAQSLECPFSSDTCLYSKNKAAVLSNTLDYSDGLKIDSDLGFIISPYVKTNYQLCLTYSYRWESNSSNMNDLRFQRTEEVDGIDLRVFQYLTVTSAWTTARNTLGGSPFSEKPFRVKFQMKSSDKDNFVWIRNVKVQDGNCDQYDSEGRAMITTEFADADYSDDFSCFNSTGFVGRHLLCDGIDDCRNGEDELPEMCQTKCTDKGIYCKPVASTEKGYCLEDTSKFCDGVQHCENGADEDVHLCNKVDFCYHPQTDYCKNDGNCVSANNQTEVKCQCTSEYDGKRCQSLIVKEVKSGFSWVWLIVVGLIAAAGALGIFLYKKR
ncbi:hypothetical protein HDE_14337 [Halotydeus destructor]|nr:hypothetical protein HDE_14337 [Halotydeus destructor]